MTTATLPSGTGIVSTYSYDNADRLTGITHVKGGSTTIASVAYTLDDVGNRSQRVDQQGTHTYTHTYSYDHLYRLTSVTYPGPNTTSYAFDAFGNRTSMTVAGNTTTYAYVTSEREGTQKSEETLGFIACKFKTVVHLSQCISRFCDLCHPLDCASWLPRAPSGGYDCVSNHLSYSQPI